MAVMPDYSEGLKKDVVEIKFLIHDLRVERFINEVIHFHVTLNTDLELCGVEQAQVLHGHDLQVLKEQAVSLRKAFQDYSNAVRNFSPDRTVLLTGRHYVTTIHSLCELVLSPLWGRVDKVLTFLPPDSRSARARMHYVNCIHFIRGVYYRIQQFLDEQNNKGVHEEFDIAPEIEEFMRDVVYGYVMEHSSGRVQIEVDHLDAAVVGGNLPRFRRMLFNLVMNAVDAMGHRDPGVLSVGATVDDTHVVLRIRDNGVGMSPDKIRQLLADRETLDGELHSLGFVFVRQTVREFAAELSIESEVGKGTTMTVRFPRVPGALPPARPNTNGYTGHLAPRFIGPLIAQSAGPAKAAASALATPETLDQPERLSDRTGASSPAAVTAPPSDRKTYGRVILHDYAICEAQYPGAIFAISVTAQDEVDLFAHAPYAEVRPHGARRHLAHVLRSDAARPARTGRREEADPHPEGPTERSRVLRVQERARRGVEFRRLRTDGPRRIRPRRAHAAPNRDAAGHARARRPPAGVLSRRRGAGEGGTLRAGPVGESAAHRAVARAAAQAPGSPPAFPNVAGMRTAGSSLRIRSPAIAPAGHPRPRRLQAHTGRTDYPSGTEGEGCGPTVAMTGTNG